MRPEQIIQSEKLYPLWRIGWLEKVFFLACRKFGKQDAKIFMDVWRGHDVSYYQGAIDFQAMKVSGAKFVILRCGYKNIKDVLFDTYMLNVNDVLPFAVYHFYDPLVNPVNQAIIESLAWYNYNGRIWLDFEFEWTGAYAASNHWKLYRDTLNAAGYETGIYTRATWWDSRVGTLAAEFGRDPFWVAQYSSSLTLIPKGATKVYIWQSGSPTYNAGQASPRIDYDLWNTEYNFTDEWGAAIHPPPTGGTMSYKGTVKTTVRIRNADNTDAGGLLYVGDVVYGEIKLAYGLQRIFYNRIYRKKDGSVQAWVGNSAVADSVTTFIDTLPGFIDPAEIITPPPASTLPDIPFAFEIGDDVKYIKQTFSGTLKPK